MNYKPVSQRGIIWGQRIGKPECPYMRRWVGNFGPYSLRLHHWYASDDQRNLHDHPWWFITCVLKGGYTDISVCPSCNDPQCEAYEYDSLRRGSIRFRRALHSHTVRVDPGGAAWTLMLTGKYKRDWGFYTSEGWMRMRKYFKTYGHHPCE